MIRYSLTVRLVPLYIVMKILHCKRFIISSDYCSIVAASESYLVSRFVDHYKECS
jgi:hypothetical protein